ncbi:histidine--tRNA ligase [Candidatus Parcubacteria bacterium]|nr:MAG: histidine--tRNA ligase [Candidatus Parcubacteria bacterium]
MPKIKKEEKKKKPEEGRFQLLRGFRDVLPPEEKFFLLLEKKVSNLAKDYGFGRIRLPILEEAVLFARSVGKDTDIVEKEMFTFVDQNETTVTLRPEATASIARAYIEHGMLNWPQPVKLFYIEPMFRREKPQSGRYRQFYQFGFEFLGTAEPVIDAQLISIANKIFSELNLRESVSIEVNSLGCKNCREEYKQELLNFLKPKKKLLCEDCKKRMQKNPLRVLDCKEPSCQAVLADAPVLLDWLCDECKDHFMKVLEFLDQLEIIYNLNPRLIRGLDYYNKTVFEIWPTEKTGSQTALAGGGRYDSLIETLGGRATPAIGFSGGVERIISLLKQKGIEPRETGQAKVYLAQIGVQAKTKAIKLLEKFHNEGIIVAENLSKDNLKAQLEQANRLKVRYTLILGQKEVLDGTILIREMEGGVQEIVDYEKAVQEIKKKLSKT